MFEFSSAGRISGLEMLRNKLVQKIPKVLIKWANKSAVIFSFCLSNLNIWPKLGKFFHCRPAGTRVDIWLFGQMRFRC